MFVYCVCVLHIFRKKYTNTIYKVFCTPGGGDHFAEGSVLAAAAIEAIHSNHHVVSCSPTKLGRRLARGWCWRTGQASPHWWAIVLICIIPSCVLFLPLCHHSPYLLFFFFERQLWLWLQWWAVAREADPHCCLRQEMKHHSLRGPVTLKNSQLCFTYQL